MDFLDDWIAWASSDYIEMHMDSGVFKNCKVLRILGDDTEHGSSYAIQFVAPNIVEFQKFAGSTAIEILAKQKEFCGDKALGFSTIMEIVHQ